MITYRNLGLHGRLGNALFELASTIGIAMDHGEDVMFPSTWMHRPYFNVPDELFGDVPSDAKESTEFVHHLDPRALPYLQDINLFWPYIHLIRDYLKPSDLAIEMMRQQPPLPDGPLLGVHVRRGDNVVDPGIPNKSDYHLCPSLDYYRRGVTEMSGLCRNLIVVSDDIPWCRQFLPADYYSEGIAQPKEHEPEFLTTVPRDWMDLFLLSQCWWLVLSGSTFGIWGAILANIPPEHVVRPDKVYGPIVAAYTNESVLFPSGWKVIPHAA